MSNELYMMRKESSDGSPSADIYYTDQVIAAMLGISVGRLHNKLSAGHPLPPRIEPPGCRHRLWPRRAVHAWLAQFTVGGVALAEATPSRLRS